MFYFDDGASDDIIEKRELAKQKYSKYLSSLLSQKYNFISDFIDLNLKNEIFKQNLDIFKTAFNSKDEDIRTGLWNCLHIDKNIDLDSLKEHLTNDEYEFVKDYVACSNNIDNLHNLEYSDNIFRNINAGYHNGIIELVPAFGKFDLSPRYLNRDYRIFRNHLIDDGDFESYALRELDDDSIDHTTDRLSNLSFFIHLKKNDEVIGFISLDSTSSISRQITTEDEKVEISLYIFKEYRNKGYARDAITLLMKHALDNDLFIPKATVRVNKYDFVKVNLNIISAYCLTDNIASIKTLEKCGFKKMGLIHSYVKIHNEYRDVYYFELSEREMYLKMFFDNFDECIKETKERENNDEK